MKNNHLKDTMGKPMKNGEKLVIIGAGELAEIAYE